MRRIEALDGKGMLDRFLATEVDFRGRIFYVPLFPDLADYDPVSNLQRVGKQAAMLTDHGLEAVIRHEESHFTFAGLPFAQQLAITAGFRSISTTSMFTSVVTTLYEMNKPHYFDWMERKSVALEAQKARGVYIASVPFPYTIDSRREVLDLSLIADEILAYGATHNWL